MFSKIPADDLRPPFFETAITGGPRVDLSLVVEAAAFLVIGLLAHFGVLHHVGSLSNSAIQYGAFSLAGGLGFLEIASRILQYCMRKPVEFSKAIEQSYQKRSYSVEGRFPSYLIDEINRTIEQTKNIEEAMDEIFKAHELTGSITVRVGAYTFTGSYTKGKRILY